MIRPGNPPRHTPARFIHLHADNPYPPIDLIKSFQVPLTLAATALAFGLVACKKETKVDATKPLEQSFATAAPEVQQNVQAVTANLKSGNYVEAVRRLDPVLNTANLTPEQTQAVGVALKQVNDAVAANPNLDTKEMYEMRKKMFFKVYGKGH